MTFSNSSAVPVLFEIPRLHVSVPGQAVMSATLSNPGSAKPSASNPSYRWRQVLLWSRSEVDNLG